MISVLTSRVQEKVATDSTKLLKNLYDYTKGVENQSNGEALPELIIEDFDQEQIWQELELQNNGCNDSFVTDVAGLIARKKRLLFPINTDDTLESKPEELDDVEESVKSNIDDPEDSESFKSISSNSDENSEDEQLLFSDDIAAKSQKKKGTVLCFKSNWQVNKNL